MIEKVHQIAQRVEELDRAVEFYRETLGLPLLGRFDPPGIAFFDFGNIRLLLERDAPPALLYLEVAAIDVSLSELTGKGVEFLGEPHMIHRDEDGRFGRPGTEEWMAFFRDSEGNLLALVERRSG